MPDLEPFTQADRDAVRDQLGREPRGVAGVAWRCPCGRPGVIATEPRLPDSSPFPTTYYLTCPRAASLIGTIEASGVMAAMTDRLADDPQLADAMTAAHESYLADREAIRVAAGMDPVPQIDGVSAGGMPGRVKCLHALAAHALAAGPGVNPLGDEVVAQLGSFWDRPCGEPQGSGEGAPESAPSGDPTPVAAIDCGTNSIRLLIASRGADGGLVEHDRRLELVRLGQAVDATGRFHPDALARTFTACEEFASVIEEAGCARIRFVATSAARDVSNRDEFFAGVRRCLGVDPEVIAGTEEAALSFGGALSGVAAAAEPVLVVDCGGGSTELVLGHRDGHILQSVSLDVGSVRLRERFLHGDPPTAEQVHEARRFVRGLLDGCGIDLAGARTAIGVAGTVTSLSAIHQGLVDYDRAKVHRSTLTAATIHGLAERLLAATVDEAEAMGPLKRRRAEVICGGALIIDELMSRLGSDELVVSETDILDGIALAMVR